MSSGAPQKTAEYALFMAPLDAWLAGWATPIDQEHAATNTSQWLRVDCPSHVILSPHTCVSFASLVFSFAFSFSLYLCSILNILQWVQAQGLSRRNCAAGPNDSIRFADLLGKTQFRVIGLG